VLRKLFAALLSLFATLAVGQGDQRALKPLIEIGDRWTYRGINILGPGTEEYDMQVASVHDNLVQVVCARKRDGKEFDGTYTGEWSSAVSCLGSVSRPPVRFLRFPLHVGDTYSVNYVTQRVRASKYTVEVEGKVTVEGWEQIEVPAGRFGALKVEVETKISQPNGGWLDRTWTLWYSPDVRRWVKLLSMAVGGDTISEELLSFKLVE